jgi:hypothetical protein
MLAEERIVILAMTMMVIDWQFEDERQTLLGLIDQALPKLPYHGKAAQLVRPARAMLTAVTPAERTQAVVDARHVLGGIIRSDLAEAVTGRVAQKLRVTA